MNDIEVKTPKWRSMIDQVTILRSWPSINVRCLDPDCR